MLGERLEPKVGQRRTAPQRERLAQIVPGSGGVAGGERRPACVHEALEAQQVELLGSKADDVSRRLGRDRIGGTLGREPSPQLRHTNLKRLHARRRQDRPPELVEQPIGRHDLVRVEQQEPEQRAPPSPRMRTTSSLGMLSWLQDRVDPAGVGNLGQRASSLRRRHRRNPSPPASTGPLPLPRSIGLHRWSHSASRRRRIMCRHTSSDAHARHARRAGDRARRRRSRGSSALTGSRQWHLLRPRTRADPNVVLQPGASRPGGPRAGSAATRSTPPRPINLATLRRHRRHAGTLTARKGTLHGTYAGKASVSDEGVITFHVRGRITKGTGQYKGAGGTVRFDGRGLPNGQLSKR